MNESALRKYSIRHPNQHQHQFPPNQQWGRIYKLLGNHDLINFKFYDDRLFNLFKPYTFPEDIPQHGQLHVYYPGHTRRSIFSVGSPGYQTYLETTGMGCLLLINDNLFIHGGLPIMNANNNIEKMIALHHQLNQPLLSVQEFEDLYQKMISFLETREYFNENRLNPYQNKHNIISCQQFVNRLIDFCMENHMNHCHVEPKEIRLFKGHCTQNEHTDDQSVLSGFMIRGDRVEIFSNFYDNGNPHPNAYYKGPKQQVVERLTNLENRDPHHIHNRTWGVTLSCDRKTNDELTPNGHPQIIKIDVMMGRGQDHASLKNIVFDHNDHSDIPNELKLLGSRVPQVILIDQNRLLLIRTTLQNMAMHMPRLNYTNFKQQFLVQEYPIFDQKKLNLQNDSVSKLTSIMDSYELEMKDIKQKYDTLIKQAPTEQEKKVRKLQQEQEEEDAFQLYDHNSQLENTRVAQMYNQAQIQHELNTMKVKNSVYGKRNRSKKCKKRKSKKRKSKKRKNGY